MPTPIFPLLNASLESKANNTMTRQRLLLLSVSAGAGHVRAAEAIRAYAEQRGDDLEVRHIDVMDFVRRPALPASTPAYYLKLVSSAPALWG